MSNTYTQDQYEKANQSNVVEAAERVFQEVLEDCGQNKKRFLNTPNILFDTEHNSYIDYMTGRGGGAVEFLAQFKDMDANRAVAFLCGEQDAGRISAFSNPKAFIAPQESDQTKHAYAYLINEKGIDRQIVNTLMNLGRIYQTTREYEKNGETKQGHSVVFAGKNAKGHVGYAYVQSAYEPRDGNHFQYTARHSDMSAGFSTQGRNDTVYVFQSPIELLSAATLEKMNGMDWRDNHRVSLGGVSPVSLESYLKAHPEVEHVVICLDGDRTGQQHAKRIEEAVAAQGYDVMVMPASEQTFNERLRERLGLEAPRQERPQENEKEADLKILEENTVEDRVFVLAYDPHAEKPYFVYEKTDGEKTDMESYPTREAAVDAMEDRIDEAEMEADEMAR